MIILRPRVVGNFSKKFHLLFGIKKLLFFNVTHQPFLGVNSLFFSINFQVVQYFYHCKIIKFFLLQLTKLTTLLKEDADKIQGLPITDSSM